MKLTCYSFIALSKTNVVEPTHACISLLVFLLFQNPPVVLYPTNISRILSSLCVRTLIDRICSMQLFSLKVLTNIFNKDVSSFVVYL